MKLWRSKPRKTRYTFADAVTEAREIRTWTDGPNPSGRRVERLALAILTQQTKERPR